MVGPRGATGVARAAGLTLGVAADALLGDPRRGHPVALLGRGAARLEEQLWADSRARGIAYTAAVLAPVAAGAVAVERWAARRRLAHLVVTAASTWAALGARSLGEEGQTMARLLEAGDLDAARARLPHLCGRSPAGLDGGELARATVESLAENTADAVVASLVWGALGGVPGIAAHRVVNTLDAMVGHRSARYARFGTASARLDDALGLVPARLTGVLASLLAPLVGGEARRTWRVVRRDHARHPSPNGGWCEAAWAGALGVTLGGRNVYGSGVEERPLLGEGPRPDAADVRHAVRLVRAVTAAASAVAFATVLALDRRSRRRRRRGGRRSRGRMTARVRSGGTPVSAPAHDSGAVPPL